MSDVVNNIFPPGPFSLALRTFLALPRVLVGLEKSSGSFWYKQLSEPLPLCRVCVRLENV